jgi:hypothetical protein
MTRRLERAAALLRSTDHSVADICMEVGLSSVGSFTTSFSAPTSDPDGVPRLPARRAPGADPDLLRDGGRPPGRIEGARVRCRRQRGEQFASEEDRSLASLTSLTWNSNQIGGRRC